MGILGILTLSERAEMMEVIKMLNSGKMKMTIFLAFFCFTFVAADECPKNITNLAYSAYDPVMGCLYADPSEEDMFDTYQKALDHCKKILGNESVLVEVYSKEEQDLVVSLMVEAEKNFMSPELSYWWSGLKDDNDDGIWHWAYSGLTANFTFWNDAAVPEFEGGFNCMQFLSATAFGGEWMTFECSNNFIQVHPFCQLPNY